MAVLVGVGCFYEKGILHGFLQDAKVEARVTEAMQKANVTKRVLLATRYVLEQREGYYG